VLRHVVRAGRARWPRVDILIRGESHYGRPEGMAWCERNRVGCIFGLAGNAGNKVLLRHVTALAEEVALERLDVPADSKMRRYGEFRYAARTWNTERRVIARVEASAQGVDSRFIVTNLAGLPKSLYEPNRSTNQIALRKGLLRARPSGKPHQGAQAAPRLGSHLLHQGHRQPVPPPDPHGRVLADAHPRAAWHRNHRSGGTPSSIPCVSA